MIGRSGACTTNTIQSDDPLEADMLLTLVDFSQTNSTQLPDDGSQDGIWDPTIVKSRLAVFGDGLEDGLLLCGSV